VQYLIRHNVQNRFLGLRCISCGEHFTIETHSRCTKCNGVLSAYYDLDHGLDLNAREASMWQFRDYLPPVSDANIVSMDEGWTPLINMERIGKEIGLESENLIGKLEGQNPTGSFKDRVASLSVSLLRAWRKRGVFLASSGNAAASMAAYSARAGIKCLILFRDDSTIAKLSQIGMYGPIVLRVKNLYKDSDSLKKAFESTQRALPDWLNGFVSAKYNPLLHDALKTISYEIAATRQNISPDYVFVPTAGGDLLYGVYKGFVELKSLGQIDKVPKMIVVQGAGASPTVNEVEGNKEEVLPRVETIAGALRSSIVSDHGVIAVRESHGFGVAVSNEEIVESQRLATKVEGVFCEASSAAALAGAAKAIRNGRIQKDESVCVILTGNGFKDYYPPFKDIGEVPFAESPTTISNSLKGII
jgi:threonine synthase